MDGAAAGGRAAHGTVLLRARQGERRRERFPVNQASGISEENALSEEESEGVSVTDMMGRTVAVPAGAESFICIGPGCLRLYCYVADKSQLAGVEEVEKSWGEEGRPYRMALEDVDSMETIGQEALATLRTPRCFLPPARM